MKVPTQRRCAICGKVKKFERNTRYCSEECKREGRIQLCMKRNGFDREDAIEWLNDIDNETSTRYHTQDPEGWHCVSCGKPSHTYRCPACKRKFLKAHGYGALAQALAQEEVLEDA